MDKYRANTVVHKVTIRKSQYDDAVTKAHEAFKEWRNVSMPARGDIVNEIGRELTANLDALRYDIKGLFRSLFQRLQTFDSYRIMTIGERHLIPTFRLSLQIFNTGSDRPLDRKSAKYESKLANL